MAKTKSIENLFNDLASYSAFLPILFFFLFFIKSRSQKLLWIIIIYCLYTYLTDLGLLYLTNRPSRVFLYSSFTFFEFAFFSTALYFIIKNSGFKKIILITSIIFAIFLIFYNLSANVVGIDSIPIGVEGILILIFSFYYLYEQMKDTEILFIYSNYTFWIVIGMMLYLAGSFFIYIYASQLPDDQVAHYWVFTNIFSIIKNIFFTIAIIINSKQPVKKRPVNYNYPS